MDVSHNAIEDFNELNNLIPRVHFESLDIDANPLTQQYGSKVIYRARILRRLQQLAILDGDLVTSKEKVKAMVMHGSESASRRQVFQMYLPQHSFIDVVYVLCAIDLTIFQRLMRRDVLDFEEDHALKVQIPVDNKSMYDV